MVQIFLRNKLRERSYVIEMGRSEHNAEQVREILLRLYHLKKGWWLMRPAGAPQCLPSLDVLLAVSNKMAKPSEASSGWCSTAQSSVSKFSSIHRLPPGVLRKIVWCIGTDVYTEFLETEGEIVVGSGGKGTSETYRRLVEVETGFVTIIVSVFEGEREGESEGKGTLLLSR